VELILLQAAFNRMFDVNVGSLNITLEGPKQTPVNVTNNQNNTYTVTFTPELSGDYKVKVISAGKDIAGSPFVCKVLRSLSG